MTRCAFLQIDGQSRLAPVIRDGLAANGVEVTLVDLRAAEPLRAYDLALLYGPMQTMTPWVERLESLDSALPVVIWYTEQCPPPHWPRGLTCVLARARYEIEAATVRRGRRLANRAGRLRALGEVLELQRRGRLRRLAVFTEAHRAYFARFGLPVCTVPLGHHPSLGERLDLRRDVDVVFLGTTVDRRRRALISRLETELAARRLSFEIHDGSPRRGYCFDAARTVLLNRARIFLNLMRQPWDDPVHRMLLAAANGALLLSEPLAPDNVGPFEIGTHLIAAGIGGLAETAAHYASSSADRDRIAGQASAFATRELTIARTCALLLEDLGV